MCKTIYLLRHVKANTSGYAMDDFDRILHSQGEQDVLRLCKYLKNNDYEFDQIIASPSVRTKTTAILVMQQIGTQSIVWNRHMYMASLYTLLGIIFKIDNHLTKVLFIGHNPAITEASKYLIQTFEHHVPPGGFVEIHFDKKIWSEIAKSTGRLVQFQIPDIFE